MPLAWTERIFCVSNPAKMLDGLWRIIDADAGARDFSDIIIFLPSRRSVRSVEKLFVQKTGGAVILPVLVGLGTAYDDLDGDEIIAPDVISNTERVLILAKLLTADPNIRNISSALPIARDLVRCQDYLQNEGIDASDVDWPALVDERYATHFQKKAEFLDIATSVLPGLMNGKITSGQKRNDDIRGWIGRLDKYKKVIVCGSTASVPATAELMEHVAGLPNGCIILPGKINGDANDFELDTNPYNSEYKFLKRIGMAHGDVSVIDVGPSDIDFFNLAFGNSGAKINMSVSAQLIECSRESEEASVVAEIAARSLANDKTVLIITPDAAGNQRIGAALACRGLSADFSGGRSGAMTNAGRAILNLFDDWIDSRAQTFDSEYKKHDCDLFKTLISVVDEFYENMSPAFQYDDDAAYAIWDAIERTSVALSSNGILLDLSDARSVIADALSGVQIRPPMIDDPRIAVLGTIESRMQTADVVILTALNEGMFPSLGYENAWLPRNTAAAVGLPSPNRKVSLQALDFMNLSCGGEIYWTRSRTAGSAVTTESRFLSRVDVAQNGINRNAGADILSAVRTSDNVPYDPLDHGAPRPPADRSDVYVTELELLIHNPYAFYVRHILRLRVRDDYWHTPDARDFGNLVHAVVERAHGKTIDQIIVELDRRALEMLPMGSILFHFWHKRFVAIAPAIFDLLSNDPNGFAEIKGCVNIAGRNVFARADRISDGVVTDIKTGNAPSKKQLETGMMPQLPLEAFMMQNGGFNAYTGQLTKTPVIRFLQLNNVKLIEYDAAATQLMIDASVDKLSQLFGRYSNDFEPYEYYETSDQKYKAYDDLARAGD